VCQCLESVGHVLSEEVLLEAEQTIELLMCLSHYQTDWRLSLASSLQLLMVIIIINENNDVNVNVKVNVNDKDRDTDNSNGKQSSSVMIL